MSKLTITYEASYEHGEKNEVSLITSNCDELEQLVDNFNAMLKLMGYDSRLEVEPISSD